MERRRCRGATLAAEMSAWGRKYQAASEELSIRVQLLEEGGPALRTEFMDELRSLRLAPLRRPLLKSSGRNPKRSKASSQRL
jgi:hypothetical protein